ncbi:LB_053 family protein [Leptospira kanakyensis]|uniref:DUF4381 domain-containing protein n=1 Tax=Leptospira kanakyensis TaxID=2484968 RepID=A0A6N4QNQ1_9LEPT|nr:hypothetical protein [Leptospira kanakyensis]MCW7470905.1 hypothetical protein [Leptospira kanakyensis]MCW7482904.1 hypothetical protein [Leptospira kanakyensis]TGK54413.1 hypothetical protein EHQ11_02340 [Leptospira kanakyensis]TGK59119.1 hypothetical protein EHQ16_12275 [Leptospira kanakyensis]TGK75269.1 hypothetical protein EHQ18_02950 [Leptospira kanakyensis]
MDKYILIFLLSSASIFGSPKEMVLETDIYVGDTVHYQIELSEQTETELYIEEGEIYEDDTMPSYKIFNVQKKESKLEASIIFFKPGNYVLPVSWEQNDEKIKSSLSIKVKSQLLGTETDIEDIEPPFVFSGPYFFRLFIILLITAINLYLLYALYLYWRSKPKVVDAFWEKQPILEETKKRLHIIESYLESENIYEKELAFKISEYLKEVYSKKLEENLLGKTDSEFLADLSNKTHIKNENLRELRIYFRNTKYDENHTKLDKESAYSVWEKIKKDFEL